MGRLRTALGCLAALALALSVGSARQRQAAFARSSQRGQLRVETTADASGAWYEFDKADPADGSSFTFTEFARRGTPGFSPAYPASPPPHVHYTQTESFTVLDGVMGYVLDGKNGTLAKGETVSIPPGLPHFFYNAGDARGVDLRVRITLRPAGEARRFFENLAGLSRDYGSVERVPPLQLLQLFRAGGVDLAVPKPAQWLLRHALPPLARLHGYAPFYEAYSTV